MGVRLWDKIHAVMHFCRARIGRGIGFVPSDYYDVDVHCTRVVLEAIRRSGSGSLCSLRYLARVQTHKMEALDTILQFRLAVGRCTAGNRCVAACFRIYEF
jgi:hypothetical protein